MKYIKAALLCASLCLLLAGCKKLESIFPTVPGTTTPAPKPKPIPDSAVMVFKMMADSINTDETLLFFQHTAPLTFSNAYDAPRGFGGGVSNLADFTTDSIPCAIRALPYSYGMRIYLGVNARNAGNYIIKTYRWHNIPDSTKAGDVPTNVWLHDALTGDSTNLRKGNYHFTMAAVPYNTYVNRFSVVLK
jgi:hypothetical protein